jgi:hypothetical protein
MQNPGPSDITKQILVWLLPKFPPFFSVLALLSATSRAPFFFARHLYRHPLGFPQPLHTWLFVCWDQVEADCIISRTVADFDRKVQPQPLTTSDIQFSGSYFCAPVYSALSNL